MSINIFSDDDGVINDEPGCEAALTEALAGLEV